MRWRWPWSSRHTVTGVRVGGWPGGAAPWCSRRNSSSLCGPSGMTVRARLVLLVAVAAVAPPAPVVPVPVRMVVRRASTGWVVRVRPVGSVQVATRVGGEGDLPAGSLLDAVVASAQADQVVVAGVAVRPGSDVVEVAEHGGDAAAGEPAAPVAGPDPFRHPGGGPVGVGAEPGRRVQPHLATGSACRSRCRGVVVEQGAGDRVTGRDLHHGGCLEAVGEPLVGDQHRLPGAGAGDLDQGIPADHGAEPVLGRLRRLPLIVCGADRGIRDGPGAGLADRSGHRDVRCPGHGGGGDGGGRDGHGDDRVDGGVAGDQVGQRLGPGPFDAGADPVGDVLAGQGVDRGPGPGGLFGGEGALPPVHPRLVGPPAQPALRRGPGRRAGAAGPG